MKKNSIRGAAALGILVVLYLLVAFFVPFPLTAVFWVSVVFTMIAFAVAAYAMYLAFMKNPDAKSKFYGFPIARIGFVYWIIQLVLSLAFMALGLWLPVWVAVVVYAIALGASVIGLISAEAVVEEIKEQEVVQKADVSFMRALQSKVNQLVSLHDAPELAAFAEELRYSDPVSSDALETVQMDLTDLVDELQQAVVDGDHEAVRILSAKATATLGERNRLCKLSKGN